MDEGYCSSSCAALLKNEAISRTAGALRFGGARNRLNQSTLRAVEENGKTALVGVDWAVTLRVVHREQVYLARPELRIGDRHQIVAAVHEPGHQTTLALQHRIERHRSEGQRDHLIDEIRIARAKVVGQVADDGVFLGALL